MTPERARTSGRARSLLLGLVALELTLLAPGCATAFVLGLPKPGPPVDVHGVEAARIESGVLALRVMHIDGEVRLLRWRPDRDREQILGPGEVEELEEWRASGAVVTSRGDGPLPDGVTWTRHRGRLWEEGRCTDDVWLAREGEVSGGRVLGTVLLVPLAVVVDAATWPLQLVALLFIL